MECTRNSSVKLAFFLAFFIIASDMCVKSEAENSHLTSGHCTKDSDCHRFCPTCRSCNCLKGICICENSNFADNIHSGQFPN
ncbi:hypothetical protein VNO77_25978 [Canavalia gladiata]|uniref:Uncharacterized protein n=1 Tax=Canavalia gladiata TaxID=3824 RepID=A0AAN9KRK3_CANGL